MNNYDLNTIYFTIGRNAKRIYDSIPEKQYKNNISKIEYYANEIDRSVGFLYHLFSGKQTGQQPSFETILRICNAFEIKIEELLEPLSDEEYEDFFKSKLQQKD